MPLHEPADGVPPVVETERGLARAAAAVAAGEGPVAIDAERASGYRYGQRAYLVQVRREGAGTWLIDPIGCPDLSPLDEAIGAAEWILHAATQDLACLAEVGLRPRQLFDTELAGRILGLPRVGLAAVVEHYLGLSLAKEHSAVDWSTRPLPEPWLRYAALDVEVLTELRNLMGVDLAAQGKSEWARQEFTSLLTWTPTERVDPWRRTSGMNTLRSRRSVAIVRELWYARDDIARERDTSIGRVLPDAALVDIAKAAPATTADLPRGHRAIAALRAPVGRGGAPRRRDPRGRPAAAHAALRRPAAAAGLGREEPAGRRPARRHAGARSPRSPRSTSSRSRTSAPPTRCGAWSGSRPPTTTRPPSSGRCSTRAARPWQAEIVAPMLVAAFEQFPNA